MPIDYLSSFPIPAQVLPPRLRGLLEPAGLSPGKLVEVACMQETDPHGEAAEHLQLLMAAVPGSDGGPVGVLNEAGHGVVEYSVPAGGAGCAAGLSPSISGYDYIVAAWGNGSFYSFNLAEKVWMTLGLTPRCIGNDDQRLVYDDLELPEFGVAEGEVSSEYCFDLKRPVCWRMSNEYLRRYLWLCGARGVRVFYYEAQLADIPEVRAIMGGEPHVEVKPETEVAWYHLDVREHNQGLYLQLWASVEAVMPELCPEQTADGVLWPGDAEPMTDRRADALVGGGDWVYLDDSFLVKYEQNAFYNSTPFRVDGRWGCSPSYKGQWSFSDCWRIGRNLIRVPMRELYKPKPDREILHARSFAIDPAGLADLDLSEEHVVAKVQRLLDVLLKLGDGLEALGAAVGLVKSASQLVGFDRNEMQANGWLAYPALSRLAQVAPLDMTQQMFLARCKSLHEVWQRIPDGHLKTLLQHAGCSRSELKGRKSLKLLEALLNIVERLNTQEEASDAFASTEEPEGWSERNEAMAPLFLNNDLRIADAHVAMGKLLVTLDSLGFDRANVNSGYGRALDFVMDAVINSLGTLATAIQKLVS